MAITKNGRTHTVLVSATLFETVIKGRVARKIEDLDEGTLLAIAESEVSVEHAHLDDLRKDWTVRLFEWKPCRGVAVNNGSDSQLLIGSLGNFPELARLLGEFIARWSLAEASLIMPMLIAINSPSQEVATAILASTNSTEGKIKLVRTAIEHIKQPQHQHLKKPIDGALKRLLKLCDERNSLCHHLWAVHAGNNNVVTIDYRKSKQGDLFTERTEEYIRDLCNRTIEVAAIICSASGSPWINADTVERYRI